MRFSQW